MNKIVILLGIVLVAAIVIGSACEGGNKNAISAECRDENAGCTVENIPCCEGLKEVPVTQPENGECSIVLPCGHVCRPCGNGICDSNENWCSCPEDCQAPGSGTELVGDITQEDLDDLKAEIEGISAEDLGGLEE